MGETGTNGGRGNFGSIVLYKRKINKRKKVMYYLKVMYSLNEAVEDDINCINL